MLWAPLGPLKALSILPPPRAPLSQSLLAIVSLGAAGRKGTWSTEAGPEEMFVNVGWINEGASNTPEQGRPGDQVWADQGAGDQLLLLTQKP